MNHKLLDLLLDLLQNINEILYDDNINVNKQEITQEIKSIIEQVQNELNEEI